MSPDLPSCFDPCEKALLQEKLLHPAEVENYLEQLNTSTLELCDIIDAVRDLIEILTVTKLPLLRHNAEYSKEELDELIQHTITAIIDSVLTAGNLLLRRIGRRPMRTLTEQYARRYQKDQHALIMAESLLKRFQEVESGLTCALEKEKTQWRKIAA